MNYLIFAGFCLISLSLWLKKQNFTLLLCAIAAIVSFWFDYISVNGLILIAVSGISAHLIQLHSRLRHYLVFVVLVSIMLAMLNSNFSHANYIMLLDNVRLSPHSKPFTMGLNIEKTLVAVLLATHLIYLNRSIAEWKMIIRAAILPSILVCLVLLAPALLTGFVRVEFKFPLPAIVLFALHNLLLVCLAEEVLFRGILQHWLHQLCGIYLRKLQPWLPILIASILFGLFHYRSGVIMIIFASIAGLFYGYAYQKTKRIEASMLVHFCLNMVHFIVFTYPSYDKLAQV